MKLKFGTKAYTPLHPTPIFGWGAAGRAADVAAARRCSRFLNCLFFVCHALNDSVCSDLANFMQTNFVIMITAESFALKYFFTLSAKAYSAKSFE